MMSDARDLGPFRQQVVEVTLQPRRIVAFPEASNFCPVEYALYRKYASVVTRRFPSARPMRKIAPPEAPRMSSLSFGLQYFERRLTLC